MNVSESLHVENYWKKELLITILTAAWRRSDGAALVEMKMPLQTRSVVQMRSVVGSAGRAREAHRNILFYDRIISFWGVLWAVAFGAMREERHKFRHKVGIRNEPSKP